MHAYSKLPAIDQGSIGPIKSEWICSISIVAQEPVVDDLNEWCFALPAMHPSQVECGGPEPLKQILIMGGEPDWVFLRASQFRCPMCLCHSLMGSSETVFSW